MPCDVHGRRHRGRGTCPLNPVPSLSQALPRRYLIVIKCPLVTIHMPICDLLNVIFARQHKNLRLFAFPNIKFPASIERLKAKSVSASWGHRSPGPLTRALPLDPFSFCCTQQLNIKIDILAHTPKLLSPVPYPLPRCFPHFRFLARPWRSDAIPYRT